jgi:hypothetical protein
VLRRLPTLSPAFVAGGYSIEIGRPARGFRGVEPLVLTRAWRLVMEDPAAEALKLDPGAEADEALAAAWHANLSGPWAKHTDPC